MKDDDWSCGCNLLGGHICGKQKSENETWGTITDKDNELSEDEINNVRSGLKVGREVICVRQFYKGNGTWDNSRGVLRDINRNRHPNSGQYLVSFSQGPYSTSNRWCYEVKTPD